MKPSDHTRSKTRWGPDYCFECSEAIQDWVKWPCRAVSRKQTDAEVTSIIDDCLSTLAPWTLPSDSDSSPSSDGAPGRSSEAGEKVGAEMID